MCDEHLGKVLDAMDELDLWKDTLLIVNTDHGFLLGEHDWYAKCAMPFWNEIAHTPLFVWDPRSAKQGTTCDSLVPGPYATNPQCSTYPQYFSAPPQCLSSVYVQNLREGVLLALWVP